MEAQLPRSRKSYCAGIERWASLAAVPFSAVFFEFDLKRLSLLLYLVPHLLAANPVRTQCVQFAVQSVQFVDQTVVDTAFAGEFHLTPL